MNVQFLTALSHLAFLFINLATTANSLPKPKEGKWKCPKVTVKNGYVRLRAGGRLAKFSCQPGFLLHGESIAACWVTMHKIGRQWDVPPPICIKRGCPGVTRLDFMFGKISTSVQGAIINFKCDAGLSLIGSSTLSCNGTNWSDRIPYCISRGSSVKASCDFEEENLCGWTTETGSDFNWRLHQFATPSHLLGTGPPYDHTLGSNNRSGHYLYLETSGSAPTNLEARLLSPVFSPIPRTNSSFCFAFWYHMHGRTIGRLRVYLNGEVVFEKQGDQGDQWRKGRVPLAPMNTSFQLRIEGTRQKLYGFLGDIAIDDLQVKWNIDCTSDLDYRSCRGRCDEEKAVDRTVCHCHPGCLDQGGMFEGGSCCEDYEFFCSTPTTTPETERDIGLGSSFPFSTTSVSPSISSIISLSFPQSSSPISSPSGFQVDSPPSSSPIPIFIPTQSDISLPTSSDEDLIPSSSHVFTPSGSPPSTSTVSLSTASTFSRPNTIPLAQTPSIAPSIDLTLSPPLPSSLPFFPSLTTSQKSSFTPSSLASSLSPSLDFSQGQSIPSLVQPLSVPNSPSHPSPSFPTSSLFTFPSTSPQPVPFTPCCPQEVSPKKLSLNIPPYSIFPTVSPSPKYKTTESQDLAKTKDEVKLTIATQSWEAIGLTHHDQKGVLWVTQELDRHLPSDPKGITELVPSPSVSSKQQSSLPPSSLPFTPEAVPALTQEESSTDPTNADEEIGGSEEMTTMLSMKWWGSLQPKNNGKWKSKWKSKSWQSEAAPVTGDEGGVLGSNKALLAIPLIVITLLLLGLSGGLLYWAKCRRGGLSSSSLSWRMRRGRSSGDDTASDVLFISSDEVLDFNLATRPQVPLHLVYHNLEESDPRHKSLSSNLAQ